MSQFFGNPKPSILSAIFYHIVKDHFYYTTDWADFAQWLDAYEIVSAPENNLNLRLVEALFHNLPNVTSVSFKGIGMLPEICYLVNRHMAQEEQENFLAFLLTKMPPTAKTMNSGHSNASSIGEIAIIASQGEKSGV